MSSIQVSMRAMQYSDLGADGAQCDGCTHGAATADSGPNRRRCTLGGFYVHRLGGCRKHAPREAVDGRVAIGPTDI